MARRTIIQVTCDRCGKEISPATEGDRVAFHYAIGRSIYEIDLCSEHAVAFDEAIMPFTAVAKPVRQTKSNIVRESRPRPKRDPSASAIRQWAIEHGIEVSARGRIPEEIRQQYLAAVGAAA